MEKPQDIRLPGVVFRPALRVVTATKLSVAVAEIILLVICSTILLPPFLFLSNKGLRVRTEKEVARKCKIEYTTHIFFSFIDSTIFY